MVPSCFFDLSLSLALPLLVGLFLGVVGRARGELVAGAEDDLAEPEGVDNSLVGVDPHVALVRSRRPSRAGRSPCSGESRAAVVVSLMPSLSFFFRSRVRPAGLGRTPTIFRSARASVRVRSLSLSSSVSGDQAGHGPRGGRVLALDGQNLSRADTLSAVDLVVVELDLAGCGWPRA